MARVKRSVHAKKKRREILGIKRFVHDAVNFLRIELPDQRAIRSCDDEHDRRRYRGSDVLDDAQAVEFRHQQVEQHQLEALCLHQVDRSRTSPRPRDGMTVGAQCRLQQCPDLLVVLHHEQS